MKKILVIIIALTGVLLARAYDYPFIVFQNTDDTTTTLSVESLTISIADGQLTVANGEGTCSLPLSSLSKMYFSQTGGQTSISELLVADADGQVTVYTVGGRQMGTYASVEKAKSALRPGLYIIKGRNRTLKITIK